ncbi:predicted protein [Chaetomium globosum CBS 148.51]|uniref:Uncharacterized protein n=1 Tax=Chaetomium globosum (strain ATCC 6205 / CBS 148.51 / DSM 1962 / NBRC 6347 / NRRL 1970) TaxID=306901 RepID=Q2GWT6_CHAGB|nr:uncharacterized protein CHGG_07568 [Chaetomium globosum CBS 148.51]EAQ86315.1 predicted protein [Chaetomium globosum CBS 148.51]
MSSLTYSADLELPPSTPQLSRFNPHDVAFGITPLARHPEAPRPRTPLGIGNGAPVPWNHWLAKHNLNQSGPNDSGSTQPNTPQIGKQTGRAALRTIIWVFKLIMFNESTKRGLSQSPSKGGYGHALDNSAQKARLFRNALRRKLVRCRIAPAEGGATQPSGAAKGDRFGGLCAPFPAIAGRGSTQETSEENDPAGRGSQPE